MLANPLNWYAGWSLVLAGFVSGAAIGLGFHREAFLGGYGSLRRRMVRLGHIALAALGMLNVLFSYSPRPRAGDAVAASVLFTAGGILMPLVCFATALNGKWRHLFALPVVALVAAVVLILIGGLP